MSKCGCENPGSYSATGTSGWDSDIDTVYFASEEIPDEMQITQKLLFDMIFLDTFGELPGHLFDTESYLSHAGMELGTESEIRTPEGQAAFTRLEISGAILQMLRQCGGLKSQAWEEYKTKHLEEAKNDPELQNALQQIFDDVEEHETYIQNQIEMQLAQTTELSQEEVDADLPQKEIFHLRKEASERCGETNQKSLKALKLAKMNYKAVGLVNISKEINRLKSSKGGITDVEKDAHQLKIATLYMLRTSFFDEGYYAQGTFLKTCSNVNGQMHQRKVEGFRETLAYAHQTNTNINTLIYQGRTFDFDYESAGKTSTRQRASSVVENHAFYHGHFSDKIREQETDTEKNLNALVATSKYSERLVEAASELLESIPLSNSKVSHAKEQLEKIKETLEKTRDLEKVKRSRYLSSTAAKSLIMERLPEDKKPSFEKDFVAFEKRIEDMRYEETLTADDFYLFMFTNLTVNKYIDSSEVELDYRGLPVTKDPYISDVLKARCGVQPNLKKEPELAKEETQRLGAVFQQSYKQTLEGLGFHSVEDVVRFNQELDAIARIAVHLSISSGILDKPIVGSDQFVDAITLSSQWKKLCPFPDPA